MEGEHENLDEPAETTSTPPRRLQAMTQPSHRSHIWGSLFAIALAVVAAGGGYYWQYSTARHNQDSLNAKVAQLEIQKAAAEQELADAQAANAKNANSSATIIDYSTWKSATLKAEKASFKYPGDWVLTNKYQAGVAPGTPFDSVTLVSPAHLTLQLSTGVDGLGGACSSPCAVMRADKFKLLGSDRYMNFVSAKGAKDSINAIVLASTPTCIISCTIPGKNIISKGQTVLPMLASLYVGSTTAAKPFALDSVAGNKDIQTAEQILATLSY